MERSELSTWQLIMEDGTYIILCMSCVYALAMVKNAVIPLLCVQYSVKVAPNKMFYDCGVLLNEDGGFDRSDYRDHDSPLSLHSFYLLEWATFGVLCMALLTNPEAQEKIHGGLLQQSICLQ